MVYSFEFYLIYVSEAPLIWVLHVYSHASYLQQNLNFSYEGKSLSSQSGSTAKLSTLDFSYRSRIPLHSVH